MTFVPGQDAPSRASVAVVIPTLNEEASIGAVVSALPRDIVDKIIVADGGSKDQTAERARRGELRHLAGQVSAVRPVLGERR
jgi:hypothetical protein